MSKKFLMLWAVLFTIPAYAHNGMTPEKMRAQLAASGSLPQQSEQQVQRQMPPQMQEIQQSRRNSIEPQMRSMMQRSSMRPSGRW